MNQSSVADNADVGCKLGFKFRNQLKNSLGSKCGSSEEIKVMSKYAWTHHQTHI